MNNENIKRVFLFLKLLYLNKKFLFETQGEGNRFQIIIAEVRKHLGAWLPGFAQLDLKQWKSKFSRYCFCFWFYPVT